MHHQFYKPPTTISQNDILWHVQSAKVVSSSNSVLQKSGQILAPFWLQLWFCKQARSPQEINWSGSPENNHLHHIPNSSEIPLNIYLSAYWNTIGSERELVAWMHSGWNVLTRGIHSKVSEQVRFKSKINLRCSHHSGSEIGRYLSNFLQLLLDIHNTVLVHNKNRSEK